MEKQGNLFENNKQEYNSISDLIKFEKFQVLHVLSESENVTNYIDFAEKDELGQRLKDGKPFDDIYNDYPCGQNVEGGMKTKYVLDVKPLNKKCPIKTLTFYGPNLQITGDMVISAKFYYGESKNQIKPGIEFNIINDPITKYSKRPIKQKEEALEIKIHNKEDKVIATFRSTEYKKFFKDSLFDNYTLEP